MKVHGTVWNNEAVNFHIIKYSLNLYLNRNSQALSQLPNINFNIQWSNLEKLMFTLFTGFDSTVLDCITESP